MIELPTPIETRLIHAAASSGQNLAKFLESLLNEYDEDHQDAKLAESAYFEFLESGQAPIDFDQVMNENGL